MSRTLVSGGTRLWGGEMVDGEWEALTLADISVSYAMTGQEIDEKSSEVLHRIIEKMRP